MNRRRLLLEKMMELEQAAINCQKCIGTCCTFEANSMLITPLETMDIYHYLKNRNLLTIDLKKKLQDTILKYRLEPKFTNNRRAYLRKSYTCPFFNFHEPGCPLPVEVKPYGCLAFNPHHKEIKAGEFCYSEKELLNKRNELNLKEDEYNKKIRDEFNLIWEKSPIPNAVLEFWDKSTQIDHKD